MEAAPLATAAGDGPVCRGTAVALRDVDGPFALAFAFTITCAWSADCTEVTRPPTGHGPHGPIGPEHDCRDPPGPAGTA
jgi:hypothetical protein